VGVVGDTVDSGYTAPPGEAVYVPYAQVSINRFSLVVRPRGRDEEGLAAARRAIRAVDPTIAAFDVVSLEALTRRANAMPALQSALLSTFAAIAIGIAAIGSYGVMSQLVHTREREFVIRLAMGAAPRGLSRMVLGENARLSLAGVVIGAGAAWILGGALEPLVFGVTPRSLQLLAAVASATQKNSADP
jgi:hypothetical protein